jgi:hypothetical protein
VRCFFIGKQKVILFPKYMENGWESTASTLKGGGSFPLTMGIEEKV